MIKKHLIILILILVAIPSHANSTKSKAEKGKKTNGPVILIDCQPYPECLWVISNLPNFTLTSINVTKSKQSQPRKNNTKKPGK